MTATMQFNSVLYLINPTSASLGSFSRGRGQLENLNLCKVVPDVTLERGVRDCLESPVKISPGDER